MNFVPRRTAWSAAIETIHPSLPGADLDLFEAVAHELDRFHGLGPLERRDPAFRILDGLAGWARVWGGQGSPYERVLQQLWDPVQGWLRTTLLDLFPGEACVLTSVPLPRFLCAQSLGTPIAFVLYHRPSWALAAGLITPGIRAQDAAWEVIHGMEKKLATGWNGPEIDAFLLGGKAGEDEDRFAALRVALGEARVPEARIQSPWSPRGEDDGPIHACFDRTEGRVRPFHPGFDPVHYNLRTRQDRERCRVEGLKETPRLLWPFEEIR
jgi:hypothetical protein